MMKLFKQQTVKTFWDNYWTTDTTSTTARTAITNKWLCAGQYTQKTHGIVKYASMKMQEVQWKQLIEMDGSGMSTFYDDNLWSQY